MPRPRSRQANCPGPAMLAESRSTITTPTVRALTAVHARRAARCAGRRPLAVGGAPAVSQPGGLVLENAVSGACGPPRARRRSGGTRAGPRRSTRTGIVRSASRRADSSVLALLSSAMRDIVSGSEGSCASARAGALAVRLARRRGSRVVLAFATLDVDREDRPLAGEPHRLEREVVEQRTVDQQLLVAAHRRCDQRQRHARADREHERAATVDHEVPAAEVGARAVVGAAELLDVRGRRRRAPASLRPCGP